MLLNVFYIKLFLQMDVHEIYCLQEDGERSVVNKGLYLYLFK